MKDQKRRIDHGNPPQADQRSSGGDAADPGAPAEHASRWEDPNIPIGNAPPLPRWPVAAQGLAWLAWVVFLVVMMLSSGD